MLIALTLITLPANAALDIFVSVLPLKYLIERVGGKHVRVESLVQPGHSPVTYEPTPRQMSALANAQLFVRVGVPFESVWLKPIRQNNPQLEIVDARERIELAPISGLSFALEKNDSTGHVHDNGDPHIWLAPLLAATIAENIRDHLIRIDRSNTQYYVSNTEDLVSELIQLDAEIRQMTADIENHKFLVFHPAWGYFARAYGLEQLAVEYEGKEPGPYALAQLVELVLQEDIQTVFVQKQFHSRVAATLADEIEGRVVVLDPLAENYFDNLRAAARAISGKSGS